MPFFQRLIERANMRLDRAHVADISLAALAKSDDPAQTLTRIATQLDLGGSPAEQAYLQGWPPILQESIRTVLHTAVWVSQQAVHERDKRPVTMAWTPGYDYNVSVWESRSTADSAGAVTVLLSSPYPDQAAGG